MVTKDIGKFDAEVVAAINKLVGSGFTFLFQFEPHGCDLHKLMIRCRWSKEDRLSYWPKVGQVHVQQSHQHRDYTGRCVTLFQR